MVNLTMAKSKSIIGNCHVYKEVFMMFYSDREMLNACSEEPSLIFTLIKQGEFETIEQLIEKKKINVNL